MIIHCFELPALTHVPQFSTISLFPVRGVSHRVFPLNLCHQCQATHIYQSLQFLLSLIFKTCQTKYHNFSGQNTRQPTICLKFKLADKDTCSSSRSVELPIPCHTDLCPFTIIVNSTATFAVISSL